MTRKRQLWILIALTSLTAICQYAVQGAMASGASPAQWAETFWGVDYALWGIRAMIEAWTLVYLFSTVAQTRRQAWVLTGLEVALIALITVTLGPALRALGLGEPLRNTVDGWAFWAWNFGIAGYTSLMIAGAGIAYRVQPHDADAPAEPATVAALQSQVVGLIGERDTARAETQQAIAAVAAWGLLPATGQARVIALACDNGDRPGVHELAVVLDCNAAQVSRGYAQAQRKKMVVQ
jgi:hypothetical protein